MIKKIIGLASWLVAGILLFFTARRWLFILFALLPARTARGENPAQPPPGVLLLAPVRNETDDLPALLGCLDRLDYPPEQLQVVLVNDGSTDNGDEILSAWTRPRANWHLLSLPDNVGKASALNAALARFAFGEIVVIYDADERPTPATLAKLVQPFAGERVAAVSGRRAVSNGMASPAASYTTFEGLVHQLITIRAKDRLNLAPAILGSNCAYRRRALAEVGYFTPGALLEDSDLTLKLVRAGWQIRYEADIISYHRAPESIAGYWRQHTRWARGFNEVTRSQGSALLFDRRLSLPVRLELLIFSLGYIDRLALLAGLGLALLRNRLVAWVLALSLLTPSLQILAALKIAREPLAMWLRVVWVPIFFLLDIAMAVSGFWGAINKLPHIWEERQARR